MNPITTLSPGHSSLKTADISLCNAGQEDERVDTSEGFGAFLHLLSLYEANQAAVPPRPIISDCQSLQGVLLDLGGDPTGTVASAVEQALDSTIGVIPLNPIEDRAGYEKVRGKIDFCRGDFNTHPIQFVTSISVLNVIPEYSSRQDHIRECFGYLPAGGFCFFKI